MYKQLYVYRASRSTLYPAQLARSRSRVRRRTQTLGRRTDHRRSCELRTAVTVQGQRNLSCESLNLQLNFLTSNK